MMVHFFECAKAEYLEHCLLLADCSLHLDQPVLHVTTFAGLEIFLQLRNALAMTVVIVDG